MTGTTIHVLMAKVLGDLPGIGKGDTAPSTMGGYRFRGIESILTALKPALASNGVFCVPEVLERLEAERTVGRDKSMYVVDLHVRWTFFGPEGDSVTASAWGCGTDMGDKATQKAMTSAFKSMLMQTFAIGDNAEDSERHVVDDSTPVHSRSVAAEPREPSFNGDRTGRVCVACHATIEGPVVRSDGGYRHKTCPAPAVLPLEAAVNGHAA